LIIDDIKPRLFLAGIFLIGFFFAGIFLTGFFLFDFFFIFFILKDAMIFQYINDKYSLL